MKKMRFLIAAVLLAALTTAVLPAAEDLKGGEAHAPAVESGKRPVVQLALLLDTSGSMDGLIDQARTQLWKIVNEFISAKRHGQRPEVQVALYEYGKASLPQSQNYLRQIVGFTTDLDKVSEALFALKTDGGEEYCGAVIQRATADLGWSANHEDLKAIYIAGNEPFSQGKVDYRQSCREAIAKGILVNTIFCGDLREGVNSHWKDGADLTDGRFMNIDQNKQVAAILAPQDGELARLSGELNKTYVAFGARGQEQMDRQRKQDANAAAAAPEAAAARAETKASELYKQGDWDLVDAAKDGKANLAMLPAAELPDAMKEMNAEERKAYVEGKAKERAEIQDKIKALSAEREKFVVAEQKKRAEAGEDTLDAAMIKTIRAQAEKKGFTFEK